MSLIGSYISRIEIRYDYLLLRLECVREPIQAFVQAIATGSTSGLDVPGPAPEVMEAKLVCDLCSIHGIRQVLN